jgi:hypothetical protein
LSLPKDKGTFMIQIIREKVTPEQVKDMLQILKAYVKLAVDIERGIFGWRWSYACRL